MAGPSGASDGITTMPAFMTALQERAEEARLVLGGSDALHCSYPRGYVKRQALYSCLTCASSPGDPGGVCLACSNTCHDGHRLIELYTKRNFKCDCGNSKYSNRCTLCPDKDAVNELNTYNQNFRGEYCSCHRPYPDPAENYTLPMMQCVLCEDWFHENHLGRPRPEEADTKDLVCSYCTEKYPFLRTYEEGSNLAEGTTTGEEREEVNVGDSEESESDNGWEAVANGATGEGGDEGVAEAGAGTDDEGDADDEMDTELLDVDDQADEGALGIFENADGESVAGDEESEDSNGDGSDSGVDVGHNGEEGDEWIVVHQYRALPGNVAEEYVDEEHGEVCKVRLHSAWRETGDGAMFMMPDWRVQLCKCTNCRNTYNYHRLGYLLDPEDTCEAYAARAADSEATSSRDEATAMQQLLSGGDRVQQLNAIEAFNSMQPQLMEFLRGFAESGEVVREEDIGDFFDGLQRSKRRRLG